MLIDYKHRCSPFSWSPDQKEIRKEKELEGGRGERGPGDLADLHSHLHIQTQVTQARES